MEEVSKAVTFTTKLLGAGTTSSNVGESLVGLALSSKPLSIVSNFSLKYMLPTISNLCLSFSDIDTILYCFVVPVNSFPSVLNNFNAQITSASGAALNALPTVRELTVPADVVTSCFSTLRFSDHVVCTKLLLSSFKFDASAEEVMLGIKSPSK